MKLPRKYWIIISKTCDKFSLCLIIHFFVSLVLIVLNCNHNYFIFLSLISLDRKCNCTLVWAPGWTLIVVNTRFDLTEDRRKNFKGFSSGHQDFDIPINTPSSGSCPVSARKLSVCWNKLLIQLLIRAESQTDKKLKSSGTVTSSLCTSIHRQACVYVSIDLMIDC